MWFCGYTNQDGVLIDELPIEVAKKMGNNLKRWCEGIPTSVEEKGG